MSTELIVRSAQMEDIQASLTLWRGYCAALDGAVSDEVTGEVWQRILASDEPIWCLLACRGAGKPVGFANLSSSDRSVILKTCSSCPKHAAAEQDGR